MSSVSAPVREINVAHSPDSDDAFMFYGLATNKVRVPGLRFNHTLCDIESETSTDGVTQTQSIEALPIGRWVAISGAAFTTGTGSNTQLGYSLLLGLGNVRLGYWWDSGINPGIKDKDAAPPNFLELASRVVSRVLPVQSCLMNEFFARFHGPARRHWYLSDGGHFENTGCYEMIRRRVASFSSDTDGHNDTLYCAACDFIRTCI